MVTNYCLATVNRWFMWTREGDLGPYCLDRNVEMKNIDWKKVKENLINVKELIDTPMSDDFLKGLGKIVAAISFIDEVMFLAISRNRNTTPLKLRQDPTLRRSNAVVNEFIKVAKKTGSKSLHSELDSLRTLVDDFFDVRHTVSHGIYLGLRMPGEVFMFMRTAHSSDIDFKRYTPIVGIKADDLNIKAELAQQIALMIIDMMKLPSPREFYSITQPDPNALDEWAKQQVAMKQAGVSPRSE
jgi:hypothetical protein